MRKIKFLFILFTSLFSVNLFAQVADDSALAKNFVQIFYKGYSKGTITRSSAKYFELSLFQLMKKVEKFSDAVFKQKGEVVLDSDYIVDGNDLPDIFKATEVKNLNSDQRKTVQ